MFKSMGADMMGTADNCTPITAEKFNDATVVADSLTFLLDREKPMIFLKSKVKEFIFTDISLVIIERDNAAGVKRTITRYNYITNQITNVRFETPGVGMTDFACEIKFNIGETYVNIDVVKSEIEVAKRYYRTLIELSIAQTKKHLMRETTLAMIHNIHVATPDAVELLFTKLPSLAQGITDASQPESYADLIKTSLMT